MALTRIKSNVQSFVQPALDAVVNVVADPMIDWLSVGQRVYIEGGGVYMVEGNTGFTWQLKLETAIAPQGNVVSVSLIYPVNEQNGGTVWGGNGKEF